MKKILLLAAVLLAQAGAYAQIKENEGKASDEVLMTVAGEPIMASEFLYIYNKNNQDAQIDPKSMDEYLDLFINFKLKVAEGKSQGLDTTQSFREELKGYRAQAIPPYMQDKAAIDSLIRLSYNRMQNDRRAAHIVIACAADADSATEAAALMKIESVRERLTTGKRIVKGKGKKQKVTYAPKEDFFAVAKAESEDPSAVDNAGELGWISVFRYVYPFEEAVYTTPVGEISPVFRSGFGFHIALVEEERPHEEVRARHIMKMLRGRVGVDPKAVIDSLYLLAKDGADFADLAKMNSDDKGSALRGGELGWFGRGMMVPEFENTAFALANVGDISEPIKSAYGWHIIRLEGKKGVEPFDSIRADIEKKVARDERMRIADESFVNKARAEYNLPATMTNEEVKAYADSKLEEKYADLRYLVHEYHDGILLFDVSLKEVWDKAAEDTKGLEAFFAKNKKNYTWAAPRYKGFIVQAKDKKMAKMASKIAKSAKRDSVESYINRRMNTDSITNVKVTYGLWETKPVIEPTKDLPVVEYLGKNVKAPQEYQDERQKVVTDYQDALEAEWVKSLRSKYEVVVNQEVFDRLKQAYAAN